MTWNENEKRKYEYQRNSNRAKSIENEIKQNSEWMA